MKYMNDKDFKKLYLSIQGEEPWYLRYLGIMPRAFVMDGTVYINDEAFYLDKRDKILLIDHEIGHLQGLEHTIFGLMSDNAVIRYLTTW